MSTLSTNDLIQAAALTTIAMEDAITNLQTTRPDELARTRDEARDAMRALYAAQGIDFDSFDAATIAAKRKMQVKVNRVVKTIRAQK